MATLTTRVSAPMRGGRSKGRTAALWSGSILLAGLFASSALPKLTGDSLGDFDRWGYPAWFMTAVGLVELVSAAAILVPRLALIGAVGMATVLVGALATIAANVNSDAGRLPITALALAAALIIGTARRPNLDVEDVTE